MYKKKQGITESRNEGHGVNAVLNEKEGNESLGACVHNTGQRNEEISHSWKHLYRSQGDEKSEQKWMQTQPPFLSTRGGTLSEPCAFLTLILHIFLEHVERDENVMHRISRIEAGWRNEGASVYCRVMRKEFTKKRLVIVPSDAEEGMKT